jgi:hypothetical protein
MNPVQRSLGAFSAHGIDFRLHHVKTTTEADTVLAGDYDVLLLHEKPFYKPALDCGRPVIFLERVDGAQLRNGRGYLGQITGIIKSYAFRDRGLYNRTADRYHVELLERAGIDCGRPLYVDVPLRVDLAIEQLAKIRTGYGFGAWQNMSFGATVGIDFSAPRPIDVHFAGSASNIYQGTEVEAHRLLALSVADTWPGQHVAKDGRPWPLRRYHHSILNSKCVLCPWGWGESTHRDYEAMLLGAVMVKPNTDHVESWPDIYRAGKTYIACEPDFSDAHDRIDHIVKHFDDYLPMRLLARKLILDAWPAEKIAGRLAMQIKELVGC